VRRATRSLWTARSKRESLERDPLKSDSLELDSLLSFDALFSEGVLDEGHLRHQIGSLNQSFGGASAGEGNVGELRPFIEALQDLIEFEVAKLQGHIHLVQHHQFLFGVSEVRERGLPSRLHQLTITLSI
jgi:hypothetical protein